MSARWNPRRLGTVQNGFRPMLGRGLPLVLALAIPLLIGGCRFGPVARNHPALQSPRGSTVALEHVGGPLTGELLEVREEGLLVLGAEGVFFLPYAGLLRGQVMSVTLRDGRLPTRGEVERLRRMSRFPYGLAPPALEELLAARGQAAVLTVEP